MNSGAFVAAKSINIHTERYGTESLRYLANKIWSVIPTEIKCPNTRNC